jgi:uncharacterized protein YgbK (DUF1537 family)
MRKLGVIADDFTGATDIAGFLVANGMTTVQTNGVPSPDFNVEADSYVISLKSRSCAKEEAVRDSLAALRWLQGQGCEQIYFKYCSTFDSTEKGNIGPVTDALMKALDTDQTVLCPALPINKRTVYKGYLFVNDQLISESGMRYHPVTPMRDSKLSRLMESQSEGKTDTLTLDTLQEGVEAVSRFLSQSRVKGYSYVVLDAISQEHLDIVAKAISDMPLVTGGSGLAASLARLNPENRKKTSEAISIGRPKVAKTIIFSGSCSEATNRQVTCYNNSADGLRIDKDALLQDPNAYTKEVLTWLIPRLDDPFAPLVYATVPPQELEFSKAKYPDGLVEHAVEEFFGNLAIELQKMGVRNFITAGGETSGKIVQSLGISAFYIGPQIDPGIPWVKAVDQDIYLALKSGNFGADDFFLKAQREMV